MKAKTRGLTPFLARLDGVVDAGQPDWAVALRRSGLTVYREEGLPHPKIEAWKYTRLDGLTRTAFEADVAAPGGLTVPDGRVAGMTEAHRLVFVNGRHNPELSDDNLADNGIEIATLGAPEAAPGWVTERIGRVLDLDGMPLAALNAALWRDGAAIKVADGAQLQKPLHLIFLAAASTPAMFQARHLLIAGRGSRATVIESHVGQEGAPTFSNSVMEVVLEDAAVLDHAKLVDEATHSFHIAATALSLGQGARYNGFVLTLGGRLVRNETRVHLAAEGAECRLGGAYVAAGDAVVDNTVFVDHASPGAASRVTFKGVIDDTARGVFQGKTLVRPQAQKSDGHQLHKALLLSPGAEIDAKPELEIYADDVKCGHGATAAQLDEDMVFYFLARGIPEASARRLLVEAFLGDVVGEIESPEIADAMSSALARRLAEIRADHGA
jgi:Fe-S cluster assembly protein SufD